MAIIRDYTEEDKAETEKIRASIANLINVVNNGKYVPFSHNELSSELEKVVEGKASSEKFDITLPNTRNEIQEYHDQIKYMLIIIMSGELNESRVITVIESLIDLGVIDKSFRADQYLLNAANNKENVKILLSQINSGEYPFEKKTIEMMTTTVSSVTHPEYKNQSANVLKTISNTIEIRFYTSFYIPLNHQVLYCRLYALMIGDDNKPVNISMPNSEIDKQSYNKEIKLFLIKIIKDQSNIYDQSNVTKAEIIKVFYDKGVIPKDLDFELELFQNAIKRGDTDLIQLFFRINFDSCIGRIYTNCHNLPLPAWQEALSHFPNVTQAQQSCTASVVNFVNHPYLIGVNGTVDLASELKAVRSKLQSCTILNSNVLHNPDITHRVMKKRTDYCDEVVTICKEATDLQQQLNKNLLVNLDEGCMIFANNRSVDNRTDLEKCKVILSDSNKNQTREFYKRDSDFKKKIDLFWNGKASLALDSNAGQYCAGHSDDYIIELFDLHKSSDSNMVAACKVIEIINYSPYSVASLLVKKGKISINDVLGLGSAENTIFPFLLKAMLKYDSAEFKMIIKKRNDVFLTGLQKKISNKDFYSLVKLFSDGIEEIKQKVENNVKSGMIQYEPGVNNYFPACQYPSLNGINRELDGQAIEFKKNVDSAINIIKHVLNRFRLFTTHSQNQIDAILNPSNLSQNRDDLVLNYIKDDNDKNRRFFYNFISYAYYALEQFLEGATDLKGLWVRGLEDVPYECRPGVGWKVGFELGGWIYSYLEREEKVLELLKEGMEKIRDSLLIRRVMPLVSKAKDAVKVFSKFIEDESRTLANGMSLICKNRRCYHIIKDRKFSFVTYFQERENAMDQDHAWSDEYDTALYNTLRYGTFETIKTKLKSFSEQSTTAVLNFEDGKMDSMLHLIARNYRIGAQDILTLIREDKISVDMLVNLVNAENITPLHIMIFNGNREILKFILSDARKNLSETSVKLRLPSLRHFYSKKIAPELKEAFGASHVIGRQYTNIGLLLKDSLGLEEVICVLKAKISHDISDLEEKMDRIIQSQQSYSASTSEIVEQVRDIVNIVHHYKVDLLNKIINITAPIQDELFDTAYFLITDLKASLNDSVANIDIIESQKVISLKKDLLVERKNRELTSLYKQLYIADDLSYTSEELDESLVNHCTTKASGQAKSFLTYDDYIKGKKDGGQRGRIERSLDNPIEDHELDHQLMELGNPVTSAGEERFFNNVNDESTMSSGASKAHPFFLIAMKSSGGIVGYFVNKVIESLTNITAQENLYPLKMVAITNPANVTDVHENGLSSESCGAQFGVSQLGIRSDPKKTAFNGIKAVSASFDLDSAVTLALYFINLTSHYLQGKDLEDSHSYTKADIKEKFISLCFQDVIHPIFSNLMRKELGSDKEGEKSFKETLEEIVKQLGKAIKDEAFERYTQSAEYFSSLISDYLMEEKPGHFHPCLRKKQEIEDELKEELQDFCKILIVLISSRLKEKKQESSSRYESQGVIDYCAYKMERAAIKIGEKFKNFSKFVIGRGFERESQESILLSNKERSEKKMEAEIKALFKDFYKYHIDSSCADEELKKESQNFYERFVHLIAHRLGKKIQEADSCSEEEFQVFYQHLADLNYTDSEIRKEIDAEFKNFGQSLVSNLLEKASREPTFYSEKKGSSSFPTKKSIEEKVEMNFKDSYQTLIDTTLVFLKGDSFSSEEEFASTLKDVTSIISCNYLGEEKSIGMVPMKSKFIFDSLRNHISEIFDDLAPVFFNFTEYDASSMKEEEKPVSREQKLPRSALNESSTSSFGGDGRESYFAHCG